MTVGRSKGGDATHKTWYAANDRKILSAAIPSAVGNPVNFCKCSYWDFWTLARFRFVKVCRISDGTYRPPGEVYLYFFCHSPSPLRLPAIPRGRLIKCAPFSKIRYLFVAIHDYCDHPSNLSH